MFFIIIFRFLENVSIKSFLSVIQLSEPQRHHWTGAASKCWSAECNIWFALSAWTTFPGWLKFLFEHKQFRVEHAKCESRFQEEWVLPSWSATPIYSIWVPIQTSSRSGWTGTTVCKFCFFEKTNLGRNAGNANLEAKPEQRWIESCIQASEASRFSESHTGDLAKREKFEPVKSCFPLSFSRVFFWKRSGKIIVDFIGSRLYKTIITLS